ncbi:PLP-dependent aminotransferase family protein [Bacillus pseudomycoides]|nr:Transcriptional regulator, GntR family with aminotransferase domain [Bacillus pseudomycoides DSM 12442]OOR49324.1 GntR family transcriptional regulator [Bacillus pseudomycoides]PDY12172.1 PLP-dependent aminotransferase family protein [Bacillus pseudomycoides]PEU49472.1 PLP-dependent aminotransferase family protein [Bacillus pseudomycoides]PFY07157.1 PLP-dependent aminotransferase family protein [Bacillus pseudomycoides]
MGMGTIVMNNTWSLLATNPPPNWNEYVKTGVHKPSKLIVQEINEIESNKDFIQLSKGELSSDIFPLETMKLVIHNVSKELDTFGYEEPKGLFPLRQTISDYVKSFGIHTSPSSILIVSGALQALQLISVGLLHRESTVLLEKPSYLYSLHVFQSTDIHLSGISMDECGIVPSDLSRRSKYNKTKNILYSIPCFHNPTGVLMLESRRKELMNVCEKEQLPIIEDDIYHELWIDELPPLSLKAMDQNGHVLYVGSLSKTLSPGLRIGWVIGPEPVIERLSDIKMQTDYGSSSLSQRVAAEWLSSGLYQKHVASVRLQLKERRKIMIQALDLYCKDIATWNAPSGGLFIWLKIQPKISMKKLFPKALSKGILLNPGRIYEEESDQHIRLSYGYVPVQDLTQGIYQISQIVRELIEP